MEITPRKLVYKTLEFDYRERIPRELWYLPWTEQNHPQMLNKVLTDFPQDIFKAPPYLKQSPATQGNPYEIGTFIDEWGCIIENRQKGIIGEVKEPLLKDWSNLEKICHPKEWLTVDIEKVNEFCRNTNKFVIAGCCPRPFERFQFIRGTENTLIDLSLYQDEAKKLLKILHDFYCELLEIWAKTDVDSFMFMDDWGSQKSLLISPEMWRDFFKPLYKDYIEIAHSNNKKIFMHSDGYIIDIYPDLIELGLDAINSQIFCMGLKNLEKFKGQITFWGEIDRQNLLPNGTEKQVKQAVNEIQERLFENGGVIAQLEFSPGTKPENVYAAFEQWNNWKP